MTAQAIAAAQTAQSIINTLDMPSKINLINEYCNYKKHVTLKTQAQFKKVCKGYGLTLSQFICWVNASKTN